MQPGATQWEYLEGEIEWCRRRLAERTPHKSSELVLAEAAQRELLRVHLMGLYWVELFLVGMCSRLSRADRELSVGQMAEIDPEHKYLYVGGTARCDTNGGVRCFLAAQTTGADFGAAPAVFARHYEHAWVAGTDKIIEEGKPLAYDALVRSWPANLFTLNFITLAGNGEVGNFRAATAAWKLEEAVVAKIGLSTAGFLNSRG
eukprot:SAG25_NODE_275_length_10545_cov_4.715968_6_plen_203_part_00